MARKPYVRKGPQVVTDKAIWKKLTAILSKKLKKEPIIQMVLLNESRYHVEYAMELAGASQTKIIHKDELEG